MANCSWNLDESSTKVTVSNTLKRLLEDYLKKTTKAHMDVRYDFKNDNAKEKARVLVFSQSSEELKKALRDIMEIDPAAIESLLILPGAVMLALGHYFSRAGKTGRIENLLFYKKRGLEIIDTLYDTYIDFCKDRTLKKDFFLGDKIGGMFGVDIFEDNIFAELVPHEKQERDRYELMLKSVMSMNGISQLMKRKSELMRKHYSGEDTTGSKSHED
jgi:hypothetical protein